MTHRPEIIPMLLLEGRTVLRKEYSRKELSELSRLLRKRGFSKLYVMDLDGIERNRPQLDLLQQLADDFSVLYEGGPRRGVNIIDPIIAGAEVAYMSTYALQSLEELEAALSVTEMVGLKIDWSEGLLACEEGIEGLPVEELLRSSQSLGIRDFAIPVEILDRSAAALVREETVLRALADRPGDEKRLTVEADSIVIRRELLEEVEGG